MNNGASQLLDISFRYSSLQTEVLILKIVDHFELGLHIS